MQWKQQLWCWSLISCCFKPIQMEIISSSDISLHLNNVKLLWVLKLRPTINTQAWRTSQSRDLCWHKSSSSSLSRVLYTHQYNPAHWCPPGSQLSSHRCRSLQSWCRISHSQLEQHSHRHERPEHTHPHLRKQPKNKILMTSSRVNVGIDL